MIYILLAVVFVVALIDHIKTWRDVKKHGLSIEANPFMRRLYKSAPELTHLKPLVVVFCVWLMGRLLGYFWEFFPHVVAIWTIVFYANLIRRNFKVTASW